MREYAVFGKNCIESKQLVVIESPRHTENEDYMPKDPTIDRPITNYGFDTVDVHGSPACLADGADVFAYTENLTEDLLRTLLEESPLSVFIVDAEMRIVYVNRAAIPAFGDITELEGRIFPEILGELWDDTRVVSILERFKHSLETGEPQSVAEEELRKPNEKPQYYEWQVSRVVLPSGNHGLLCYFRDVSGQVYSREAAASSTKRYRELFDSIYEGFCIVQVIFDDEKAVDFRCLEINRTFEREAGFGDVVGKNILDLIPNLEPEWIEFFGNVAQTGRSMRFEGKVASVGRWFEVYAYQYGEAGNNQVAILFKNISERKRTEEALRQSEERYRALVHASANIVWRTGPTGSHIRSIEGGLSGRPAERLETSAEWYPTVHPEDLEMTVAKWEKAVEGKQEYDHIYRSLSPDKGYQYIQSRAVPLLDEEGNIREWVGTATDVTDRIRAEEEVRRSEAKLRLVTECFTDHAIFSLDKNGIIESWNLGAVNIFGYSSTEAIGKHFSVVFTPEDVAAGRPELEITTALEKGRAADERWHVRKDGSRFFASGTVAPLIDEERGLIGFAKIARDLTEQKKAEQALRDAAELLESRVEERTRDLKRSNQALREEIRDRRRIEEDRVSLLRKIVTTQEDERRRIARDLHDQLGQQLTGLRLKVASLKTKCSPYKEIHPDVERIEEIGAKLDTQVNFLAWELRPTALDDLGLIDAVQNYVRAWSRQFDIPAAFHTNGGLVKRVDSEIETNLYRIAQEALNNVFKHSAAESVSVILEVRNADVVLIVEDNGRGFEPDEVGPADETGRGLGIIGMRERAAIVGGKIEIESSPGRGTTIFVRVPLVYSRRY